MARLASTDLDEAFEAARADFVGSLKRRSLPAAQALSKATTIQHVLDAIAEVEAQQQRSGKLRALGRLKPLVNGLKEYAGVVEVFIQAKQDILSLIWVSRRGGEREEFNADVYLLFAHRVHSSLFSRYVLRCLVTVVAAVRFSHILPKGYEQSHHAFREDDRGLL